MPFSNKIKKWWHYEPPEPPTWWKYIIVCCNLVFTLFCIGLNYGLWKLVRELDKFFDDYHRVREEVDMKWIIYINIFMFGITAPLASFLANKYGHRFTAFSGAILSTFGLLFAGFTKSVGFLCFSYGILTGIGYSLVLIPGLGLVPRYFPRRYTFANAMAFLGTSISIYFFPPLFDVVAETYGRRSVFFVLSYLNAQMIILTMFLRPPKTKDDVASTASQSPAHQSDVATDTDPDDQTCSESCSENLEQIKKYLDVQLFYDSPPFVMMVVSMFFISIGHNVVILNLINHSLAMGNSNTFSERLLIVCGGCMFLGELAHGLLSIGLHFRARLSMYGFSLAGVALVAILSSLPSSYSGFIIMAALIGFLSGVYLPLMVVIIKHFIRDGWRLTSALGLAFPLFGLGALIGLPIADLLNESFDNVNSSYFFAGVALMVGALMLVSTPYLREKQRERQNITEKVMESEDEVDASIQPHLYEEVASSSSVKSSPAHNSKSEKSPTHSLGSKSHDVEKKETDMANIV
ncbi:monocarboxylate transporter 13-like [Saccoglossus kowalevskii]|uniref:Monocarboxylate transporter 13-like n=1 Tax=Saccoglossus kowalevskii TaxID=10224 RepID=A0ABM0GK62_SACKO|nr:PREDICTED: monocarboxylate transporter 13-like [Saccoglossus kowalevskii]